MRYYETKKHLANTPQEYFVLRILNQNGQLINVRTGKRWGYIASIIKADNLKRWEA